MSTSKGPDNSMLEFVSDLPARHAAGRKRNEWDARIVKAAHQRPGEWLMVKPEYWPDHLKGGKVAQIRIKAAYPEVEVKVRKEHLYVRYVPEAE